MDVKGGYAAKKKLDAEREKALEGKSDAEKAEDRGDTRVVIVKKAGHHLYLDNADEFNDFMKKEMDDVRKSKV